MLGSLVLFVFCVKEKMKSSSVGVRGTGAGQPSPALLLTMEHKSQMHCHRETETGLSEKKVNTLKCPKRLGQLLESLSQSEGQGKQHSDIPMETFPQCGELKNQPAAQATVPAGFHMITS